MPALAQMPTADQRMQQVHEQYQRDLDGCDRDYQNKIAALSNGRYHIPASRALAEQELQRCRAWAQHRFESAGRLRYQPR